MLPDWRPVIDRLCGVQSQDVCRLLKQKVEEHLKRDTDAQIQGRSQIAPIFEAFLTAFDEEPKLKFTGTVHCEAALAAALVNGEAADVNGEWQPLAKVRPRHDPCLVIL